MSVQSADQIWEQFDAAIGRRDFREALRVLDILQQTDAKYPDISNSFAYVYLQMAKYDACEAWANKAILDDLNDPEPYRLLGACYYCRAIEEGDCRLAEKAIGYLKDAQNRWQCEEDHDRATLVLLAKAYILAGQYSLAEKAFWQASFIQPLSYECAFEFGSFLFKRRRYSEAADWFERSISLPGSSAEAFTLLARTYHILGLDVAAIRIWNWRCERYPGENCFDMQPNSEVFSLN